MSKPINVFITTLDPNDAAGFYRVTTTFSHLSQKFGGVEYSINAEASYHNLLKSDVIFMHRPTVECLEMFRLAKMMKKPIWIEWDDHCLDLPMDHPHYFEYKEPRRVEAFKEFFRDADLVTFMTEEGKKSLSGFSTHPGEVIEMAFHEDFVADRPKPKQERNKVVFWRGSRTHHRSLMHYKDAIIELSQKHPDWTFRFQGDNPWFIYEKCKNWYCETFYRDPLPFYKFMYELQPAISMVPLVDNAFTRCRSNLALMEGALGGSVCVAPHWEHWKCRGGYTYFTNDGAENNFIEVMSFVMDNFKDLNTDSSWKHIEENLMLREVNKKRLKILKELCR